MALEWPRGCKGWSLPELVQFIKKHNLFVAEPDGCALDMKDEQGVPHLKQWRVVTSSYRLAKNLDTHKCEHPVGFHHSRTEVGFLFRKDVQMHKQFPVCPRGASDANRSS